MVMQLYISFKNRGMNKAKNFCSYRKGDMGGNQEVDGISIQIMTFSLIEAKM